MGHDNDVMKEIYQFNDIEDDEYLSGFMEEDMVKEILEKQER